MKDLSDSKRLFNTISALPSSIRSPVRGKKRPPEGGIGPITATIISALFWPHLQEEELNLPDQVCSQHHTPGRCPPGASPRLRRATCSLLCRSRVSRTIPTTL